MVDCSHGNSSKNHRNQALVIDSILEQLQSPDHGIMGVMIESFLVEGAQKVGPSMVYGQSVTDACIGLDETVTVLERLASVNRSNS
jgi:3-deoxy-7-phosphoheptulonate synthase